MSFEREIHALTAEPSLQGLMLRPQVSFVLILAYFARCGLKFLFLHMTSPGLWYLYCKQDIFHRMSSLQLCDHQFSVYQCIKLSSSSLQSCGLLVSATMLRFLYYQSSAKCLEIKLGWDARRCVSPQRTCDSSDVFTLYFRFVIDLAISTKKKERKNFGDFQWDCVGIACSPYNDSDRINCVPILSPLPKEQTSLCC